MNFREDPRLLRFAEATKAFRILMDQDEPKGKAFIRAMFPVLTELYAAGVGLQPIRVDRTSEDLLPSLEREWIPLWNRIGPDACYWMLFDPTKDDHASEPVAGNLGDDLTDIYLEIIPGLNVWEGTDESRVSDAVWEWQVNFSIHWGSRAVNALGVMYRLEMEQGWPYAYEDWGLRLEGE